MNYIINPSWFYWLNVCDCLNRISCPILALMIALFVLLGGIFAISPDSEWDDKNSKRRCEKIEKVLGALIIVFFIVYLFIPSKDTLIEMQVAKFATHENAEWTVETVKGAVDYIVEAIKTVNG